jgi:hypothetical protein
MCPILGSCEARSSEAPAKSEEDTSLRQTESSFSSYSFLLRGLNICVFRWLGGTSPAGERGSAAGLLLSPRRPNCTRACVSACCAGHHPSSPFALSGSSVGQRGILRSIHLLSCTCNTTYVRILMLFNIFLHPSRSPASPPSAWKPGEVLTRVVCTPAGGLLFVHLQALVTSFSGGTAFSLPENAQARSR